MNVKKYFVAAATLLCIVNCNKKSDPVLPTLEGKWELVSVVGAWVGRQTFPPGNGNTFEFDKSTYTHNFRNADTAFQESSTYSVFRGKSCEAASVQTLIQFGNNSIPYVLNLSAATFTFDVSGECYMDGTLSTYRRVFP